MQKTPSFCSIECTTIQHQQPVSAASISSRHQHLVSAAGISSQHQQPALQFVKYVFEA
jgi:hypothetical protein